MKTAFKTLIFILGLTAFGQVSEAYVYDGYGSYGNFYNNYPNYYQNYYQNYYPNNYYNGGNNYGYNQAYNNYNPYQYQYRSYNYRAFSAKAPVNSYISYYGNYYR